MRVAKVLKNLGIPAYYKASATDLGIDVRAGRARVCKRANERKQAANRRYGRALRLRRLGPRPRK
eukprot:8716287-Pyramimonas_sp.AAC.1